MIRQQHISPSLRRPHIKVDRPSGPQYTHEDIQRQVEDYLANGGQIERVPFSQVKVEAPKLSRFERDRLFNGHDAKKECKRCGKGFTRRKNEGDDRWLNRGYCSNSCANKAMKQWRASENKFK